MRNLRIEEENITKEMALQNGKKLLEEKDKLRLMEKAINDKTSSYKLAVSDKKDSMFYKQLVAALLFGCSMLLDAIFCASAIMQPVFRGATYFILETSLVGFGMSAILTAVNVYDRRKLNKLHLAFEKELEELTCDKEVIKDNIHELEKLPHIENNMDLMQYDEKAILESIKKELENLKEEKEQEKLKHYKL